MSNDLIVVLQRPVRLVLKFFTNWYNYQFVSKNFDIHKVLPNTPTSAPCYHEERKDRYTTTSNNYGNHVTKKRQLSAPPTYTSSGCFATRLVVVLLRYLDTAIRYVFDVLLSFHCI